MTEPDDHAVATAELLHAEALARGYWVSGDLRIGLDDAARLIGQSPGGLRNQVTDGTGPPTYRLGGAGHKRTVRILELAEWIESRRD
jgi:hypothetical protein